MGALALNPQQRVLRTRELLEKAKEQIVKALPAHLKSADPAGERFRRIILSLVNGPRMDRIPPEQFVIGAIRAAEIGLEVDAFYGHLYLIPYGEKLQPQIGYKGIIELAWRSGQVKDVCAEVVWKEDKFTYKRTARELVLEHEPNFTVEHDWAKEEPLAAYAIARLKDGGEAVVVLPGHEVRRRRDRSQAVQAAKKYKKQTPWDTDPEAMWKKTGVRALAPWIPQCPQLARALQIEDQSERELIGAIDADFVPLDDPTPETPQEGEFTTAGPTDTAEQEGSESPWSDPEPLKKDDFTPKELNNLYTWMWTAKGHNKALVNDWITRFRGTKEQCLKSAEEEAKKATEGRE